MASYDFIWTDDNIEHIAEHDVTTDEAEHVVEHPEGVGANRVGDPIAFGYTVAGRHLAVPFVFLDDAETLVYVHSAYDTPPKQRR